MIKVNIMLGNGIVALSHGRLSNGDYAISYRECSETEIGDRPDKVLNTVVTVGIPNMRALDQLKYQLEQVGEMIINDKEKLNEN